MIVKRNGNYQVRYFDGLGNRPSKTFDTKREAQAFEDEMRQQLRRGEYIAPKMIPTFGAKAEEWFKTTANCRAGTTANYRGILDNWLLPRFRNQRLDRVDVQTVEKFRTEIGEQTGHCNVCQIIAVLGRVFEMARRHKQIRENPVDDLPRLTRKAAEIVDEDDADRGTVDPTKVLNPTEVGILLNNAEDGLDRALLTTAALTGMRDGELFALRWSEVDFATAKISVERTLSWARVLPAKSETGERAEVGPVSPRFYPPKTKTSRRTFPIPSQLVSILRVWKLRCPKGKDNLVFPAPDGTPLHRSRALKGSLRPTLRRAKLRPVTLHSLRHSFASALIGNGSSVVEVQHLLGHSSATITLKVYTHFFPTAQSDSVSRLASAILGGNSPRRDSDTSASDDGVANVSATA